MEWATHHPLQDTVMSEAAGDVSAAEPKLLRKKIEDWNWFTVWNWFTCTVVFVVVVAVFLGLIFYEHTRISLLESELSLLESELSHLKSELNARISNLESKLSHLEDELKKRWF